MQSLAQAGEVGDVFQYAISGAVTLPRRSSAMLPIVSARVRGTRVSIYNQSAHAVHPLLGLKLTNSSGVDLMGGPVTLFDGETYAGDAQVDNLSAGDERLLSYALDLETEVAPSSRGIPEELVSVRMAKGTLIATRLYRRETTYTVRSSGSRGRSVLIEHPISSGWELEKPQKPEEKTRSSYRFLVELPAPSRERPGAVVRELEVAEKRSVAQSISLASISDDQILLYTRASVVSAAMRAALEEIARRRQELSRSTAARQEAERGVQQIGTDQQRIRENMSRLERDSALYKRYVTQLDEQEDQLEALRERIAELREQELAQRRALEEYLLSLELE
jgi:hypothetical protein